MESLTAVMRPLHKKVKMVSWTLCTHCVEIWNLNCSWDIPSISQWVFLLFEFSHWALTYFYPENLQSFCPGWPSFKLMKNQWVVMKHSAGPVRILCCGWTVSSLCVCALTRSEALAWRHCPSWMMSLNNWLSLISCALPCGKSYQTCPTHNPLWLLCILSVAPGVGLKGQSALLPLNRGSDFVMDHFLSGLLEVWSFRGVSQWSHAQNYRLKKRTTGQE